MELTFGGEVEDIIHSLSFPNNDKKYIPTLGGRIWWKDIEIKNGFTVQQNMLSKHYRILANNHRRTCFSFELEYINKRLKELTD